MSYFCDIYEKLIGVCGLIAIVGFFITVSCLIAPQVAGAKKVLRLGVFLILAAGVIFLFLPSKEFVCGV